MEQRVVQVRRRRVGVAVDARAHLGEVVEVVGRPRHELLLRLGDDLTGVAGLGLGQRRHLGGNQIAKLADECGALWRGQAGPFGKGGLGGSNGGVDLRFAA